MGFPRSRKFVPGSPSDPNYCTQSRISRDQYPDLESQKFVSGSLIQGGICANRTKSTTAHQNNWQNLLNVPRSGIGYKFWFWCPHNVTGSQDQYPNLKIRYPHLSSQNRQVGSERFGYRFWDPGTDLGIWRRSGYKFSGSRKSYLFFGQPKKNLFIESCRL